MTDPAARSEADADAFAPSEVVTIAFLLDLLVFAVAATLGWEATVIAVVALGAANLLALGYALIGYVFGGGAGEVADGV